MSKGHFGIHHGLQDTHYKAREIKTKKADRNAKNNIEFLMEQMVSLLDGMPEKSKYTVEEWNQELKSRGGLV